MDNTNNNVKIFASVIGLLILGTIATVLLQSNSSSVPPGPGKLDAFATCLKDKGATFYGAFWCPHCQAEKKLFGSSAHLLPYVECSTPDASGQTQICIDKNITSYPTWILADGTRLPTENEAGVTLQTLAAKTSCQLPT
jgi:thiol-disulfide isomerase/thioredoxin